MNTADLRDLVASDIATAARDGVLLDTSTIHQALDLGLDVEAIENNPAAHILPIEVIYHG